MLLLGRRADMLALPISVLPEQESLHSVIFHVPAEERPMSTSQCSRM